MAAVTVGILGKFSERPSGPSKLFLIWGTNRMWNAPPGLLNDGTTHF